MTVNSKTPMALYKANLELVLRIGTLLQENRRRWAQAGAAGTSEAIERTLAETERMLTTNDWTSLSAMPGEDFWKSMRGGATPLQGTIESAVRSQTEFAEGLKQAFAEWQQQSAAALGTTAAQPVAWTFPDIMKGFVPSPKRPLEPQVRAKARPAPEPAAKAAKSTKAKAAPATKARPKTPPKPAQKSPAGKKRKPTRK